MRTIKWFSFVAMWSMEHVVPPGPRMLGCRCCHCCGHQIARQLGNGGSLGDIFAREIRNRAAHKLRFGREKGGSATLEWKGRLARIARAAHYQDITQNAISNIQYHHPTSRRHQPIDLYSAVDPRIIRVDQVCTVLWRSPTIPVFTYVVDLGCLLENMGL